MIKTIIVATDGSSHAQKAVALAADIAPKYEASVVVLHVLLKGRLPEGMRRMAEVEHIISEEGSVSGSASANVPGEMRNFLRIGRDQALPARVYEFAAERILADAERALKEAGVKEISKIMMEGDPAECILHCAKDHSADMIMFGSRGLSEIKGLLFGSVSHKVSQLAPCTCIAVR